MKRTEKKKKKKRRAKLGLSLVALSSSLFLFFIRWMRMLKFVKAGSDQRRKKGKIKNNCFDGENKQSKADLVQLDT